MLRTNSKLESGTDDSSFVLNYGHQQSDGYRVHSASSKDYVLLTGDYQPGPRRSIGFYASYNHSFEQLAGQLTEQQFLDGANVGELPYLQNNGHVAIDSFRLGLSHRYAFTSGFANNTIAYASGYKLDQPFAVGLSDNLVLGAGGRTEFNFRVGQASGTVGSELQANDSFKKSYGLTNGVLGAIRGDLQVRTVQSNTFAQVAVELPEQFTLTGGASLNVVRYSIADRLASPANPGHKDQSGIKSFDPIVTPRLALERAFGDEVSVYAQVSQGYTPPGSGAVVIPQTGQVNSDLRPERGTLFEVGSKGALLAGRLTYEAALFLLRVQDKLTPQAITDPNTNTSYSITTNGGAQNDEGLELSLHYRPIEQQSGPVRRLQLFGSWALSRFRYDGFKSDNNNGANTVDYSGNTVVGVPDQLLGLGADLDTAFGFYANSTLQYVGSMQLTFDNQHSAKSYALLNAKVGYRTELPESFRLEAAVGAKNLTGSTYYTMAFLNQAYPPPGNTTIPAPSVYLPGPGATVFGTVTLSRSF